MNYSTQAESILNHLKLHREGITPLEALNKYGCLRLAAVIAVLKKEGHNITTHIERGLSNKKHWARYQLSPNPAIASPSMRKSPRGIPEPVGGQFGLRTCKCGGLLTEQPSCAQNYLLRVCLKCGKIHAERIEK